MTIITQWKNQDGTKYKLDADNLHRMSHDLNTLSDPFLSATAIRTLQLAAHTDIKIINANTHKVFEIGNAAQSFVFDAALLDTGTVAAGTDYYVYLCDIADGTAEIKVSLNATFPAGYDADSSRKIGGFHTICADVGTIASHPLSGYVAGDILPNSVWCLNHRPATPEGMTYDSALGVWVDIYLASVSAGELESANSATIADGASAEKFHWYKFSQWFARAGKRLPSQHEFVSLSIGSNQGTNIAGSGDPVTTGGHTDTDGRRMISNIGCEDACGALWQWGSETGHTGLSSVYADAFDANDSDVAGRHYAAPNRPLFGGYWPSGSLCGSRGSYWSYGPLLLYSSIGARGVAEPI